MTVEFPALSLLLTDFKGKLDQLPANAKGTQAANRALQTKADEIVAALNVCALKDEHLVAFEEQCSQAQARFQVIKSNGGFSRWFGSSTTAQKAESALSKCKSKIEELQKLKLQSAIDKIKGCAATKALYDASMKQGWQISFSKEEPALKFGGFTSFNRKAIFLSERKPLDAIVEIILFELINVSHEKRFSQVADQARQLPCEEYVQQKVQIEFDGALLHHGAIEKAHAEQPNASWKKLDRFAGFTTFEKFWETYQKGPHAAHHRKVWQRLMLQL